MKKMLCISLALLLLLSMAYYPRACAAINYCSAFEDAINLLRWHSPYWDIAEGEAFPVSSIINYTKQLLCCDEYGEEPITEGDYTYFARYAIPADVFEAAAMDFFAVVDVNALRSYTSFFWDHANFTGIDGFQNYQEDRQVYLFSNTGSFGEPSGYQVLGYEKEKDSYTVHARFVSLTWGKPNGVEGQDYVIIDGLYYRIDHYLVTVLSISNGRVQFHSWDETDSRPDGELTLPLTVMLQQENITIAAGAGVFPEDAFFQVAMPEEEAMGSVKAALGDLAADFVAYDITASAQPAGAAQVTFAAPQGFDVHKLALFHITEDGTAKRQRAVVDTDNGTITAEVTQFGLFAVVELPEADPQVGDVNGDGKINARDVRLILQYNAGLIVETELSVYVADFNDDGKVNVRDARLILRSTAGLDED